MGENPEWDLVANYVLSGNSVLVLGPNMPHSCVAVSGGHLPDHYAFLNECCEHFGLNAKDFSSDQEIVDYLTRNRASEATTREYVRVRFRAKRTTTAIAAVAHFVWRRIYSYSLSDAIEVAYRQTPGATQKAIVVEPSSPVTRERSSNKLLELIKLNGDGLSDTTPNVFTNPRFRDLVRASRWHSALRLDVELHPVIILGSETDTDFLFQEFRSIRRTEGQQQIVFIAPDLRPHQIELLHAQSGIYINANGLEFLGALLDAFPNGRNLNEIAKQSIGFSLNNADLRDVVLDSFTVLTSEKLQEKSDEQTTQRGIYPLYKGDNVKWSDIVRGIHADLTPYKNWRGRIDREMNQRFPGGRAFTLTSPAGMGKTIGLMSAAYWLRQRTPLPILWLEPDGDLRGFLLKLTARDFDPGVFVFVDDVTNFIDAFDNVDPEKLQKIAFVFASRETRWQSMARSCRRRFLPRSSR